MTRIELEKMITMGEVISKLDISGEDLSGADFSGALFEGVSFRGCNLSGVGFRESVLVGCDAD